MRRRCLQWGGWGSITRLIKAKLVSTSVCSTTVGIFTPCQIQICSKCINITLCEFLLIYNTNDGLLLLYKALLQAFVNKIYSKWAGWTGIYSGLSEHWCEIKVHISYFGVPRPPYSFIILIASSWPSLTNWQRISLNNRLLAGLVFPSQNSFHCRGGHVSWPNIFLSSGYRSLLLSTSIVRYVGACLFP